MVVSVVGTLGIVMAAIEDWGIVFKAAYSNSVNVAHKQYDDMRLGDMPDTITKTMAEALRSC